MNPYVSVFSSTAVTAQNDNSRRKVLTTASTTLSVYLKMMEDCRLLPLAVRVECHTVDWAEVTFDPAKLLFIGSMEEPEYSKEGGYHHNTTSGSWKE